MKQVFVFICFASLVCFSACSITSPMGVYQSQASPFNDTIITQSLFNDRSSSITEENIQKILAGSYELPQKLRVAMVKLEPAATRRYSWGYRLDERYLKTQQSYLDLFAEKFRQSSRVTELNIIPDLLISKTPTFTNIRETAVRMQADIVVIYSITSDTYSRFKLFSKDDIKAFATTQLILLDVRTGLIPFSSIVTRDFLSQKQKDEVDIAEATSRIQHEAVLLTVSEIGSQITSFLAKR